LAQTKFSTRGQFLVDLILNPNFLPSTFSNKSDFEKEKLMKDSSITAIWQKAVLLHYKFLIKICNHSTNP
jgi:hypothetical protein